MVLPIPIDYLERGDRLRKLKAAESLAEKELSKRIEQVITRTAKPSDFELTGNTFKFSLGGTGHDTLVDKILDDDETIAIYGFVNLSTNPTITRIVIKNGAETLADINLEDMYAHDVPEVLLDKPIVFTPKSRMVIEAYNTATAATDETFIIKAIVAEKAGKTVTKPSH